MLLSYLFPFPIRNLPAPLLWVFYRQLGKFREGEATYVGSSDYFIDLRVVEETRAWEMNPANQARLGYRLPEPEQLARAERQLIDVSMYAPLVAQTGSGLRAWTSLMTTAYPPLCRRLAEIFRTVSQKSPIDAVVSFGNCASLRKVAKQFGVPVIHNELGALRAPLFQPTVYVDFRGVNGNTEAAARFQRFKCEVEREGMPLLSRQELCELVAAAPIQPPVQPEPCEFDLGLALQVEDDSNLIAFGNGYSNYELIVTALQFVEVERLLVRPHPFGSLDYRRTAWKPIQIDESPTSIDFIRRCKRIATINSSVALESMLIGRPACILGQSPFDFMATGGFAGLFQQTGECSPERLLQLNFAVLGYLVPESLLFELPYYCWRLRRPSELEIYRFHLNYYRAQAERRRSEQEAEQRAAAAATAAESSAAVVADSTSACRALQLYVGPPTATGTDEAAA
jgi:hypothetical protein